MVASARRTIAITTSRRSRNLKAVQVVTASFGLDDEASRHDRCNGLDVVPSDNGFEHVAIAST